MHCVLIVLLLFVLLFVLCGRSIVCIDCIVNVPSFICIVIRMIMRIDSRFIVRTIGPIDVHNMCCIIVRVAIRIVIRVVLFALCY